jgi:hypothetical protein
LDTSPCQCWSFPVYHCCLCHSGCLHSIKYPCKRGKVLGTIFDSIFDSIILCFIYNYYSGMFGLWSQGCMPVLKKSNSIPGKLHASELLLGPFLDDLCSVCAVNLWWLEKAGWNCCS